MTPATRIALALALALAAIAGCGSDDRAPSEVAGAPSVRFLEPESGAVESGAVTAIVELDNFLIHAADIGQQNRPGRGHLMFSMDGGRFDERRYSGSNGELARQLGTEGRYSPSIEPTISYRCLPVGVHRLEVELLNNDRTPVGASDAVSFEVASQRPGCRPRGRRRQP